MTTIAPGSSEPLTPAPPSTLRGFGRPTTPTFLALRVGVDGDRCCRR